MAVYPPRTWRTVSHLATIPYLCGAIYEFSTAIDAKGRDGYEFDGTATGHGRYFQPLNKLLCNCAATGLCRHLIMRSQYFSSLDGEDRAAGLERQRAERDADLRARIARYGGEPVCAEAFEPF